MVTAGTYRKVPIFRSAKRLELLFDSLLHVCETHGWLLQAWAVFPNHYHFVAVSPEKAQTLKDLAQELHSITAREVNRLDNDSGRRVWFEYWETRLTFEKSYMARLSYVHNNPVKHGLVRVAADYPWCSAGWFQRKAAVAFYRTVMSFTGKGAKVPDDYDVNVDLISSLE